MGTPARAPTSAPRAASSSALAVAERAAASRSRRWKTTGYSTTTTAGSFARVAVIENARRKTFSRESSVAIHFAIMGFCDTTIFDEFIKDVNDYFKLRIYPSEKKKYILRHRRFVNGF